MKLLFISIRDVSRKNSGGEKCTNRNYVSFCEILGKENVEVVNISDHHEESIFKATTRRLNFLAGYYAGFSAQIKDVILEKSTSFDFIFIDASYLGIIAYHLKRAHYKGRIISFFHNVEVSIMKQKANLNLFNSWKIWSIRYNERMAVKYSDKLVALTGKDKEELKRIYGTKRVEVIPISLPDEYIFHEQGLTEMPPVFLFIGDNWYPNIHGIRWFIKNVLDHVDIKMQIAGRNMECYRDEFSHPNIEFLGFVDDLPKLIGEADYFLCPIFTGGGMKVKICEALMHGKHIIGTTEAFEGYDMDFNETGAVCNNAEEFIDTIKGYCSVSRERFNAKSRAYYLEKYAFSSTLDLFRNLLH